MTNPIGPEEIVGHKVATTPSKVFEIFNELLARAWNGYSATVRQEEVVQQLVEAGFDRKRIFDDHMLDVEPAYRAQGWKVVYDRPSYNETYPATFKFSKKDKSN